MNDIKTTIDETRKLCQKVKKVNNLKYIGWCVGAAWCIANIYKIGFVDGSTRTVEKVFDIIEEDL